MLTSVFGIRFSAKNTGLIKIVALDRNNGTLHSDINTQICRGIGTTGYHCLLLSSSPKLTYVLTTLQIPDIAQVLQVQSGKPLNIISFHKGKPKTENLNQNCVRSEKHQLTLLLITVKSYLYCFIFG